MTDKRALFTASSPSFPRAQARAHLAKAIALAAFAASLPAHANNPDISQIQSRDRQEYIAHRTNALPVAVTDFVLLKNAAQAINVLANDTDADHDSLMVIEASAKHGAVAFTADGLVAYAADPAHPLPDEISYVLSDGRGGSATGKVIIADR